MDIKRSWINQYVEQLNALSDAAQEALKQALSEVDLEDPEALQTIMEIMNEVCGWATDQSATLATYFYDGLREQMVGEPFGAEPINTREPGATYTATAGIMKNPTAAEQMLLNRLSYEIKRAAGNCVIENTYREHQMGVATVGWARVPGVSEHYGSGGCPFCKMLASRGFVYVSKETALGKTDDHYHADCTCSVVPSWDKGTKAEGYNPEQYWDEWKTWTEETAKKRSAESGRTYEQELKAIYDHYEEVADLAHEKHDSAYNRQKGNYQKQKFVGGAHDKSENRL